MDTVDPYWQPQPRTYPDTLTVGQLNQLVKRSLEQNFDKIVVTGEIANFSRPTSGHIYFTLKDASGELRCVLFRMRQLSDYVHLLKDGVAVELTGQITLYAQRGQYQMIVSSLRLAGEGLLKQQFLALKKRLEAEGLFDSTIKKTLPIYPKVIGVISSPSAAGLGDFLTILQKRYPICEVRIFSSLVQGEHASDQLIRALQYAEADTAIDVIVFCRGGGSLEDMWCFNNEALAQAIHRCPKPLMSAIGHERDVTICDLCADVRAATPTNAAMLIAPDSNELAQYLDQNLSRLLVSMRHLHQTKLLVFNQVRARICHPRIRIQQGLVNLSQNTRQLLGAMLRTHQHAHARYRVMMDRCTPSILNSHFQRAHKQFDDTYRRLIDTIRHIMVQHRHQIHHLSGQISAFNPYHVLRRGYGMTKYQQQVISSVRQVTQGAEIEIILSDGVLNAVVQAINTDSEQQ